MPIREPVAPELHRVLRRAVLDHLRECAGTQGGPPMLHVGTPGGATCTQELSPEYDGSDACLRADLLAAMHQAMRDCTEPIVGWLTRRGTVHAREDVDLDWAQAALTVSREMQTELPFVIVGRQGWHDPLSEVGRHWARLREY